MLPIIAAGPSTNIPDLDLFKPKNTAPKYRKYADFKKEYDGVFVYNSENQYDLSPYYSFDDEKAELHGMQIMLQQDAF